jgi:hypothetical protein
MLRKTCGFAVLVALLGGLALTLGGDALLIAQTKKLTKPNIVYKKLPLAKIKPKTSISPKALVYDTNSTAKPGEAQGWSVPCGGPTNQARVNAVNGVSGNIWMDIYDPSGNLVAYDHNGSPGAVLNFNGSGTFYIVITNKGSSDLWYHLQVDSPAPPGP